MFRRTLYRDNQLKVYDIIAEQQSFLSDFLVCCLMPKIKPVRVEVLKSPTIFKNYNLTFLFKKKHLLECLFARKIIFRKLVSKVFYLLLKNRKNPQ
jgi:hypothetical protein